MVVSEFYEGQGLGNQLWTYVATRAIADRLNIGFAIKSPEKFKGHDIFSLDMGMYDEAIQHQIFTEETFYDHELNTFISDYDPSFLELNGNIEIKGNFQSEKYFLNDRKLLRKYLTLSPRKQASRIDKNTAVLYVRGGEYKRHKNLILPQSYWYAAINILKENYGINNFVAVSDDDQYVKSILPAIKIYEGNMTDDFFDLYDAKYAVISNSSWGYFPVALSDNKKITLAPEYWGRHNQSLRWASPANFYDEFKWIGKNGKIIDNQAAKISVDNSILYYKNNYIVKVKREQCIRKNLREIIPYNYRQILKKIIGRIFPRIIG
ncbi:alpha-1,2-fucosyltransferase [Polynucleobacter sp. Nonnen-W13]|uniref:alpha-1,2-fucosyltransferase n=1 Tax=Polynucleobacter sp. Nonnen-W13 TaxID=1855625 RepID=UPI001C0C6C38|nr:alpha-1,2-fucosyltransferase [Polynucleobacter sp. Nonnen-W13]MBU3558361.1 alpha-1,2-fucosyltransferase [Polynucleobacter sp. Nonnen-W13]